MCFFFLMGIVVYKLKKEDFVSKNEIQKKNKILCKDVSTWFQGRTCVRERNIPLFCLYMLSTATTPVSTAAAVVLDRFNINMLRESEKSSRTFYISLTKKKKN